MLNIRGKRASASQFDKREFDKDNLEAAINLLSYGCEVLKYNKSDKKPIKRIYYIFEDDLDYLQYIHPNKPYEECRICLLDIIELKEVPTCELFKNLHPSKVLQITFSTKKHVLQFELAQERDLFWQGLQYFLEIAEKQLNYGFTKLERTLFLENDLNQNRQLDIQEIKQLLEDLQIFINPKELIQIFNRFDKNKSGQIDYIEYKQLIKTILNQDQFKGLYLKYCTNLRDDIDVYFDDNHGYMTKSDFINFLQQEQRSSNDQAFKNFASLNKERQYLMSFNQFFAYLLSIQNQLFDITKQSLYQSTDHPLTDYWINSSHNTYLMNNQLTGESSTQAYINALQKGCRCVELDCWDGPNNTPIIFHGYTMTSKITFESVIQVINEYAFKYSPFPLILSLEVHCSVKQQDAMADIINHYLGEYILLLPDDYMVTEYYPTLEQLKRKIIIKHRGNMRSSLMHRGRFQAPVANPNECYDSNNQQFDSENNMKKRTLNRQNHGLVPPKAKDDPDAEHEADEETLPRKKFHTSNIQPTLRPKYKLKYMGTSFNSFEPNPRIQTENAPIIKHDSDDDISPDIPKKKVEESLKMSSLTALFGSSLNQKGKTVWEIVSIEENKVDTKLIDFHRRYFTRIYPAGSRVDSSNFDPINAYNSGSQIVALNFQTNDMPMLINTCKFMENGGIESGYILKPLWMRSEGKKNLMDFKQIQLKLTITILVAYNLRPQDKRKNIVDPQIKITLRGIPQDELANPQKKSQTIKNNGFNPQFNYKFNIDLRCPDLAFLVFEVSDNGKEFLGWNAIPISAVTYGYRALYLLNQNLKQIPNSCLVIHL